MTHNERSACAFRERFRFRLVGVSLAFSVLPCTSWGNEVPAPLVKAVESRLKPRTAILNYRLTTHYPRGGIQVERITARFAGENFELTEFGDDDGVVVFDPDKSPLGVRNACLPQRHVVDRTSQPPMCWSHWGSYDHVGAAQTENGAFFVDPRTIGLCLQPCRRMSCHDVMKAHWVLKEPDEYSLRMDGNLIRLARIIGETSDEPPCKIVSEYAIDPRMDHAIVSMSTEQRCTDQAPDPMTIARSAYEQIDGYWWPVHFESENLRSGYRFVYQLEHAEFDRPEHPKSIGPDDLGMPPGVPVYHPDYVDKPGELPARYLGGGKVVSKSEWELIKSDYDLHALQEWIEACRAKGSGYFPAWWDDASGRFGLEGVEHKPDEWEAYVRRWILKRSSGEAYKLAEPLTEKQKTAAWAVLADCKKRSHPIVEKRAAELAEARKRLGENRKVIEDLRAQTGATEQGNADQGKGIAAATPAGAKHATAAGGSAGEMPKPSTGGSEEAKPVAREDERLTQAMQASQRLLAAVRELEKPDGRLAEIFEELKRRLDGLLTSVQRSDANVLPPPAVKPQSMRDGSPAPLPQRDPRQAPQAAPRLPTPARP